MDSGATARRPVAARRTAWASATARWLARRGLRPNQISLASTAFAALAGLALVTGARLGTGRQILLLLLAVLCIELRLLCNLMDGMLAVEGGMQTASGPIYNELPDRLSDAIMLVCAGYAVTGLDWASALGWAAALLALLTAYVRALGGSLGLAQDFCGPMAKQQRMQALAAACVIGAALAPAGWSRWAILTALIVILAGSAATVARRMLHTSGELNAQ